MVFPISQTRDPCRYNPCHRLTAVEEDRCMDLRVGKMVAMTTEWLLVLQLRKNRQCVILKLALSLIRRIRRMLRMGRRKRLWRNRREEENKKQGTRWAIDARTLIVLLTSFELDSDSTQPSTTSQYIQCPLPRHFFFFFFFFFFVFVLFVPFDDLEGSRHTRGSFIEGRCSVVESFLIRFIECFRQE